MGFDAQVHLGSGQASMLTVSLPGTNVPYYNFEDIVAEESHGLFAHANYDAATRSVTFVGLDGNGDDVLSRSHSLSDTTIPAREIRRLERTLNHLHHMAEDPASRTSVRTFLREFRIPSPRLMPEAYRIVGRFRKRLIVLWGFEKSVDCSVLPLTASARDAAMKANSIEWNLGSRVSVRSLFFDWRKVARAALVGLLLASLAGYFVFLSPARCHHGEIVGYGIGGRFNRQTCPNTCQQSGCGEHLDADLSCPTCRCKICGAKRQLNVEGTCVEPPDEERCMATVGLEKAHRCGRHCKPNGSGGPARCAQCVAVDL